MMCFVYIFRDKSGVKREATIEAASREAAFAALKAKGISPLGLREGGKATKGYKGANGFKNPKSVSTGLKGFKVLPAALLILAILGGAAWWFLAHEDAPLPEDVDSRKSKAMPKEVKPSIPLRSATPATPKKATHKANIPQTPEEQLAWIRKKYGDNIPENLKTTVYFLEHPPTQTYKPLPQPEDVFKHQSEKTIAAVLLMKPGTFVMRRTVYDESFDDDFKKAMAEPTEIEDGDSDETKELKAAVKEVKDEWAGKMRNGEKPSEIMNEVMNTAYELGKYSRQIEEMLHETVDDPSMSNRDVEDFVEAANIMLKGKGLDQIEMPNLLRRQARLRRIARKAQEQQEQKDVK